MLTSVCADGASPGVYVAGTTTPELSTHTLGRGVRLSSLFRLLIKLELLKKGGSAVMNRSENFKVVAVACSCIGIPVEQNFCNAEQILEK